MSTLQNQADPDMVPLDTLSFPLWGSRLIEASAGTGKTYTIASLYVRLVLGHGNLPEQKALTPPDILVVTFTRAATKELRDRIRLRLNQAAACFLEEAEGDEFLQGLRGEYAPEHWISCARQLQIAAEWMDDAAVSTIDAWCYRVLREHAFDSGSLFNVEMDIDPAEIVAEATRDYWRLFIAPLPPAVFAEVVALTKNCDQFAEMLSKSWLAQQSSYQNAAPPKELVARRDAALAACKQPWKQWVPEMDALMQKAYADKLFDRRKLNASNLGNWMRRLEDWAEDPERHTPFESAAPWHRLTPQGLAEIWKDTAAVPQHPGFDALVSLRHQIDDACAQLQRVFCHAAQWVAARIAELREQRAMLDFNGLLEQLDAALQGPNGERLARLIRMQFPAALIDEFQDTNPVQYRIFDSVYGVERNSRDVLLALIGDPKQAIYAFRGADIHAYLAARQACEGRIYTLGRNFRSSAAMVGAVNHLFDYGERHRDRGAFLFRKSAPGTTALPNPVPFHPVEAAKDPGDFMVLGEVQKALTLWVEADAEISAEEVASSCATEILRLLQLAKQGEAGFQSEKGFHPLKARDIAILVNSGNQAACIARELRSRGIRSVYLSDKASVFTSAAAGDMLVWLRACAEPENGGHVRAALASGGLGLDWNTLDELVHDEARWEDMLARFSSYKEQWRQQGVLPMLRRFMHDFGVPARLFAEQEAGGSEGERHLTDLLHLAELLQAASASLDGEHALIRYLEEKISIGGDADADGDVARLRLESDAGLVQIVTVHKAKGLEYPLVFYPYGYEAWAVKQLKLPATYHDATGKLCVLANPADADPEQQQKIQALLEHERLAEDLRKLYVALTRSRHACWMALIPHRNLAASAMGYLLGGTQQCLPETLKEAVSTLTGSCADIDVQPLPQAADGWLRPEVDDAGAGYMWRSMQRRITPSWSLSSYSSLSRFAMVHAAADTPTAQDIAMLALPDDARLDNFLEGYLTDQVNEPGLQNVMAKPGTASSGLHGFPKGATAGTFLHDLLEWAIRQGPKNVLADESRLREQVDRRCEHRGWTEHAPAVKDWLKDFLTRDFHVGRGRGEVSLVLSELVTLLPEMEFWFGINDARLPALDRLVSSHFLPGRARAVMTQGRLRGLLRGFIDLVFEHEGRYYVADYKSNWLGPDDSAYDTDAIAAAILEHRYDLQSALYLYALHRLLKSRLGDAYDYDTHVGGAMVFFIRGAASTTQGVYFEKPAAALMEDIELLFSTTVTGSSEHGESSVCS